jgi:hypothetical protein
MFMPVLLKTAPATGGDLKIPDMKPRRFPAPTNQDPSHHI